MPDFALDLAHVAKTYPKGVRALDGIEMRVHRGEIFGLLGPNGAGKSTLVKILMTVIRASRAEGTLLGSPVGSKGALSRVGYLPEHHRFPDYLTGGQVLDFYGAMAMVPRADRRRRRAELLELVGMANWERAKVRSYSKGMRQRVGIAQALMNDPDLVVLDEPTDGVDPVGRRDIRAIVNELKRRGKTVFINSHLLSELEMVCDRVAILVQGRVVSQGTIDELTRDQVRYEIEGSGDVAGAIAPLLAEGGAALRSGERVILRAEGVTVHTTEAGVVQPVIDRLRAAGIAIRAVRPIRPSLEDLFMQAVIDPTTGKSLAPGARMGRSPREGSARP